MENVRNESLCRVCDKAVTARQHALECDLCRRWVHRLCGTGMSLKEYREVMRCLTDGGEFAWTCGHCSSSVAAESVLGGATVGDIKDNELVVGGGQPLLGSTRVTSASDGG